MQPASCDLVASWPVAGWYLVTADAVRALVAGSRLGHGSVPARVRVGQYVALRRSTTNGQASRRSRRCCSNAATDGDYQFRHSHSVRPRSSAFGIHQAPAWTGSPPRSRRWAFNSREEPSDRSHTYRASKAPQDFSLKFRLRHCGDASRGAPQTGVPSSGFEIVCAGLYGCRGSARVTDGADTPAPLGGEISKRRVTTGPRFDGRPATISRMEVRLFVRR